MSTLVQLATSCSNADFADLVPSIIAPILPPSQPHTQNSLYLTFKVAQLISSFRRRVKTRALSHAPRNNVSTKKVQTELCQEFERQAYEEIDEYLGKRKKTSRHHDHARTRMSISVNGETEDDSPPIRQTNWIKL